MSDLVSKVEFEMNEALRVVSHSANRRHAALYLCRVVRKAVLAGNTWNTVPIGLDWLIRNGTEFKRWVPDASPLFRSFIDEPHYIRHIVHDEHLLWLVAPDRLEAFVSEALHKHPPTSFAWLNAADAAGLSTEKQVAILVETIDAALKCRDDASYRYIAGFLQASSDRSMRKWDILSTAQFYDTLRRCAELCPGSAVNTAERLVPYLEARLTPEQRATFFDLIPGSGSWSCGVESVAVLPHAVQCRLVAKALHVPTEVLEHVVTIPNGQEAVIAYLQRPTQHTDHAGQEDTQHIVRSDVDAWLQALKAAPGRRISDVTVKLPVL